MIVYLQMIETNEDKSKFEEIYQEYRNLMYYVAYKRMQHEQDAEDVVHHVFVKIAENIKHIEPVSPKTKQLIVTMVDNRVTDIFRVRGRHPVVMYDDELKNSPVIGNEGEGVGRLIKEKCDFTASIPMKGNIDSLNASVAAGVLAYEIVRQRMAK